MCSQQASPQSLQEVRISVARAQDLGQRPGLDLDALILQRAAHGEVRGLVLQQVDGNLTRPVPERGAHGRQPVREVGACPRARRAEAARPLMACASFNRDSPNPGSSRLSLVEQQNQRTGPDATGENLGPRLRGLLSGTPVGGLPTRSPSGSGDSATTGASRARPRSGRRPDARRSETQRSPLPASSRPAGGSTVAASSCRCPGGP